MEWWLIFIIMIVTIVILLFTGIPVFLCFTIFNILAVFLLWGGAAGLAQLVSSMYSSVATFTLVPVAMFVLMGEVLFYTGLFFPAMDIIDTWLGRLPGRLAIVGIGTSVITGMMTGSSFGTTAVLGTTLRPEMERRGYHPLLAMGVCMTGALAMIIPPSAPTVITAAIAQVSVGRLLIAGFLPGFLLAAIYVIYVMGRCILQPSIAPPYSVTRIRLSAKIKNTVRDVVPLLFIIFSVTGTIFAGIASPSEAAAIGALACFIMAAIYRKLNWKVIEQSVSASVTTTGMILVILIGSVAFGQIMAFTGLSKSFVASIIDMGMSPLLFIITIQVVAFILGMFMDGMSITMILVPLVMPVVNALRIDPIWFLMLFIINMETGTLTPPFGLVLFTMKGVSPPETKMYDVYQASIPFVICNVIAIVVLMSFPAIVTWLPNIILK